MLPSSTPSSPKRPVLSRRAAAFAAFAVVVVAGYLSAGPLNPPAGPVTTTSKTLAQAEPRTAVNTANTPGDADSLFTITESGSYYLTGNITGITGKHGIKISPSHVGGITLDLNGFQIIGVGSGGGAFSGVNVTGPATCITVINGTVRGWGGSGINFVTPSTARNFRVSGISTLFNVGTGIVAPACSNVSDCTAYGNAGAGISVDFACTVSNCLSSSNVGAGITTLDCCTVTGCTSLNSSVGINLGPYSRITGCAARSNDLDGIRALYGSTISGNTCTSNSQNGINVTGSGTRVEDNKCIRGSTGISIGVSHNIIMRNTCTACTGVPWVIAANNAYGSIWNSNGNGYAGVNGFSSNDGAASDDANANYTQ